MKSLIKFNVFLAALSFFSGIANLYVGSFAYGLEEYSNFEAFLALSQICLAALVAITGFARLEWIKGKFLAKLHFGCAIVFYFFIALVVYFI